MRSREEIQNTVLEKLDLPIEEEAMKKGSVRGAMVLINVLEVLLDIREAVAHTNEMLYKLRMK